MCEVTKSNFKDLYPKIEKSLRKATFIAIDCEFSGLVLHSKLKNSLFDSSSDRYLKLKCSIEQFTVFQLGLAIFHYSRNCNKYKADIYSFYTFPCSFGPVDNRFLCQATSWEFLRGHNFDFNKVAYEGIPFLNNTQESLIRNQLGAGTMFSNLERSLSYRDEDRLQEECSRVAQWLPLAAVGESLEVMVGHTEYCLIYFLQKEIRARFKDVWTFHKKNKITVKKLNAEDIKKYYESEGNNLDCSFLDNILGISKVFKLLVALKKPLIGHNMLLDLMILYNQMFEPLPSSYAAFKKQLNVLFPSIHDTKYLSYRVQDFMKKPGHWTSNRLDHLYIYFSSSKGIRLALFSPIIEVQEEGATCVENVEAHLHEAAWDAYMSGYCFIRLAHFLANFRLGENALPRALTRVEHFSAVAEYENCVNVIRGNISHMNISGEDPQSNRPRLLCITRFDRKAINLEQVTALMATHGSVDVKSYTNSTALIAVPNMSSAQDIVRAFVGNKEYKVDIYSSLWHALIKKIVWSGLVLSGTLCLAAFVMNSVLHK